ncbi:MAG: sigma-70 family RNA polymerase sigma factor [Patulibacter sp.]|nr:sigma-70 family RNA polymerase sigma factor [Patulibacter sp.]
MSESSRAPSAPVPRPGSDRRHRRSVGGAQGGAGTLEQALRDHHELMLRRARRLSLCEDDAHDAVQAAAERYLRYHQRVDPETVTGWLVTVTRNEALRIRNGRVRIEGPDPDEHQLPHHGESPAELAERGEALDLAREALAALKPQERQALILQAEGHSYDEIADRLDWTRTRVNRNITEGRARLRDQVRGIAAGEGCARAKPRIERLVRGEASADDLIALRPHLRRCISCRARLRRARGSHWVAVPPVLLGWLPWVGRLGGAPPTRTRVGTLVADRIATLLPATGNVVSEAGLAVTAGVAATALAAGTIAVTNERPTDRPRPVTPSTHRAQADPGLLTAGATPSFRAPSTAATAASAGAGATATATPKRQPRRDRSTAPRPAEPPAGATAQREFGPETAPASGARTPATSGGSAGAGAVPKASNAANSRGSAEREFGIEP